MKRVFWILLAIAVAVAVFGWNPFSSYRDTSGLLADEDTEMSALSVTWRSDRDGVIGTGVPDETGLVSTLVDAPSAGTHTVTLSVIDEADLQCSDVISLVVNSAPSAFAVHIDPRQSAPYLAC